MGGHETPAADVRADGELDQPVKLVVWDLDETFWRGTLAEGAVDLDQSRIDLVRALNRKGIVNSICSNNDESEVRARLDAVDLWDAFVFASIDWLPKGPRVAQIIESAQLRPENVLFIDDLITNREEVSHFSPGIQTAPPEIIEALPVLPQLQGKDDRQLSRLQQYRLLELKAADRRATGSATNEEFLRSCEIRIGLFKDVPAETERLYELAHRTNQLNFTKRQTEHDEFAAMLADPDYETGYVRVRDRYGDHGICGFYALRIADHVLVDFLFSCRVLHLGVEQWVYDHLGRPTLDIVGEVASSLDVDGDIDWIELDNEAVGHDAEAPAHAAGPTERVLMVGGCDLMAAAHFLRGEMHTDFSRTGPLGTLIHVEHTEVLRQSVDGLSEEALEVVDRIPFLDRGVFRSPVVVDPAYDVLVYSVLMDYTQGLYRHRDLGFVVPWHRFDEDVTEPANWRAVNAWFERRGGIDDEFLAWFSKEFEFIGGPTVDRFKANIRWLAGTVPPHVRIVFLNGAEVPFNLEREPGRHLHHRAFNDALDEVVAELPSATVCDLRTFILTESDLSEDLRHYRRKGYLQLAEAITAAGTPKVEVLHYTLLDRVNGRLRRYSRQLVRRVRARMA
jgi:FkbH-like protein